MSQLSGSGDFRPVVTKRSSQRVADEISRTIVDGTFRAGDVLPPERDLARRFQVTRNTVREAMRSLEQLRLVSIRQGSGVTVQDYVATAGVEFIGSLLSTGAFDGELMGDLWEARAVLGRAMFERAIDRFDRTKTGPVAEAVGAFAAEATKEQPSPSKLQELEFDVHGALLRGAGNQAFLFLHNSLRHIYEPVAHLFEPIVARPAWLAGEYRRGLQALERGQRDRAKATFCASLSVGAKTPESATSKPAASRRRAKPTKARRK